MRVAIVSDVHANMEGLTAVLRHAVAGGQLDAVWCLGDIVGYGPEPGAVIDELRSHALAAVAGNHDRAATGLMDVADFNPAAASAVRWTQDQLSPEHHRFLAELPLTTVSGDFTLVHGSLRDPVWEYLLSTEQADAQFAQQTTPYSLIGHSHLPLWFEERPGRGAGFHRTPEDTPLQLGDTRLIINPGSCGQPRDGDPRASYVLYDSAAATVTWYRVPYDIPATQGKMRAARLNSWLIERLAIGQ
jgi:diadenosine tetraphosphatase ApaH/serine/threonine PP2A family protein phosphatase